MKNPIGGLRRKAVVALSTIGLGVGLLVAPVAPAQSAGILPTTTTVQASASPVLVGTPVTLKAKVSVLGLGGLLVTPTGQRDVHRGQRRATGHAGQRQAVPVPGARDPLHGDAHHVCAGGGHEHDHRVVRRRPAGGREL